MTQRLFLDMPIFSTASRRLPRHRHTQPVLICTRQITELRCIPASNVTPFLAQPTVSPRLEDFAIANSRPVRRARKNNGDVFEVADLGRCETLSFEELVQSIMSETDHPYYPLLEPLSRNTSIVLPGKESDHRSEAAAAWLGRLLSVDDEIFVPTVPPTLAISLDLENRQLVAVISCPPSLSPSIRLPTLHMPLTTEEAVLERMAVRLEVELRLDIPQSRTPVISGADNWILTTLADLHRYIVRKGSREWPVDIPFDTLSRATGQVLRVELASPPLDWLGHFMDTPREVFGNLDGYIGGLQRLLLARYEALGEDLPPMPSDVFIDLCP